MLVNAPVEWSPYLEHCWELVFHHVLYERRRDPVSSVDSSSTGWIPKLSPLREPKGSLVFSLSPAITPVHAKITDIRSVPFRLRLPQLVVPRDVHSLR